MKKFIFALITLTTISIASCCDGNTTNQETTEKTTETVIDSVCNEEPENDSVVSVDTIESKPSTETVE
jgi:hypothetical protein